MLVDVVKTLSDNGEDVVLILPGPDHENGQLNQYIEYNGMTDYVEWITNEGSKLGKYDMKMVYVESLKKNLS